MRNRPKPRTTHMKTNHQPSLNTPQNPLSIHSFKQVYKRADTHGSMKKKRTTHLRPDIQLIHANNITTKISDIHIYSRYVGSQ